MSKNKTYPKHGYLLLLDRFFVCLIANLRQKFWIVPCHRKSREICDTTESEFFQRSLLFRYIFACTGFVKYMLEHGMKPGHPDLGFIKKRQGKSGTIKEWVSFAEKIRKNANKGIKTKGWKLVAAPKYIRPRPVEDLRPGDILVHDITLPNHAHGHVMIAMDKAKTKKGAKISTLDIADSSVNPKGPKDKRGKRKETGMGEGTINLRKNKAGDLEMQATCSKKNNPKTCKTGKDWVKLYDVRPV